MLGNSSTELKNAVSTPTEEFPQSYKIVSPKFPPSLKFAGEGVPLENFEVFERIEREILVNTYWHSATVLTLKRANRWFPLIESILRKNRIPEDFKYIAAIESGLANVVSPAKATGFWQLLSEPAKKYGLEVNNEVDERYDVEMATEAACKYLHEAYNKFGNWTLAAASYNMGMTGVARQLERQKTNNYYNLVLGEETSRYIARAVAMKVIMLNPKNYGYQIEDENLYAPLKWNEVELSDQKVNLADYAFSQGANYKILKYYNPWLRDDMLINKSGKTYKIKLPVKGSINMIE
ncbi:MAG: lytic transglycosylase domain-containing protein [Ignavibacteriaceae bacterium]|nr:lytic transglycosylase domain-containing protein [Ignavibacteriaceae bacterium]